MPVSRVRLTRLGRGRQFDHWLLFPDRGPGLIEPQPGFKTLVVLLRVQQGDGLLLDADRLVELAQFRMSSGQRIQLVVADFRGRFASRFFRILSTTDGAARS